VPAATITVLALATLGMSAKMVSVYLFATVLSTLFIEELRALFQIMGSFIAYKF
jgi:hypothetical protein